MYPVENHGDWMKGMSGSRRMASEATTESPRVAEHMTGKPQINQQEVTLLDANNTMSDRSVTQAGKGRWAGFSRRYIERQRGDRLRPTAISEMGPVDWIQATRGILFFGVLGTTVWLEWVAIKAIATYVATYF